VFCREDEKKKMNIVNLTETPVSSVEQIMLKLDSGL
jgi:hypothetical protein